MKIARPYWLLLALVGLSLHAIESKAQLSKTTTSYVSDSAGVLPLWLAKEAGIFARNGLDVQAVRVHAAVGVMALMSGELQFVLISGPVAVESALRGSNMVYVAGGMSTLDFVLVTRPEIKTAEQLKGGTVGLSAIRGANPTATRFALQKLGLAPKDVSLQVDRRHQRAHRQPAAGKNSRDVIQSAAKYHGPARRLQCSGRCRRARLAVRAYRRWRPPAPIIRDKPEIVRRYVKSHIEAVALMKTDRELGDQGAGEIPRADKRARCAGEIL